MTTLASIDVTPPLQLGKGGFNLMISREESESLFSITRGRIVLISPSEACDSELTELLNA